MNSRNLKAIVRNKGITFVEVMLAFLILGMVFIPIFTFLTNSVKETEKFYTETIAISRAKFIMDTLMFQIPWRCIREGAAGIGKIDDPKDVPGVNAFISRVVPKMFGEGTGPTGSGAYNADGLFTCRKGFKYRARLKVVDLDYDSTSANPITFSIPVPGKSYPPFDINKLTSKDADDKYNLIKKLIIQVKWSNHKGKDPNDDPWAKSFFLIGFKSKLGE